MNILSEKPIGHYGSKDLSDLPCIISEMLYWIRVEPGMSRTAVFQSFRRISLYSDKTNEELIDMVTKIGVKLKNRGRIRITDNDGEIYYYPRGRVMKRVYGMYYGLNDLMKKIMERN